MSFLLLESSSKALLENADDFLLEDQVLSVTPIAEEDAAVALSYEVSTERTISVEAVNETDAAQVFVLHRAAWPTYAEETDEALAVGWVSGPALRLYVDKAPTLQSANEFDVAEVLLLDPRPLAASVTSAAEIDSAQALVYALNTATFVTITPVIERG
jgi:hypothetical protein